MGPHLTERSYPKAGRTSGKHESDIATRESWRLSLVASADPNVRSGGRKAAPAGPTKSLQ